VLAIYRKFSSEFSGNYERAERRLVRFSDDDERKKVFDEYKSRTNRAIRKHLGPLAPLFQIRPGRGRPLSRYGLVGIRPDRIRFAGSAKAAVDACLDHS